MKFTKPAKKTEKYTKVHPFTIDLLAVYGECTGTYRNCGGGSTYEICPGNYTKCQYEKTEFS